MNSFRLFAGTDGCTARAMPEMVSSEIGAKSRNGSYGSFLNRNCALACVPMWQLTRV
ncbi:hypothetical protein D3C83_174320 [compost metagenome]